MPPPFSQRQAASTSWPALRRLMAGMRSCVAMGSNPPRRPWTRPDLNLLDKPVETGCRRCDRPQGLGAGGTRRTSTGELVPLASI